MEFTNSDAFEAIGRLYAENITLRRQVAKLINELSEAKQRPAAAEQQEKN